MTNVLFGKQWEYQKKRWKMIESIFGDDADDMNEDDVLLTDDEEDSAAPSGGVVVEYESEAASDISETTGNLIEDAKKWNEMQEPIGGKNFVSVKKGKDGKSVVSFTDKPPKLNLRPPRDEVKEEKKKPPSKSVPDPNAKSAAVKKLEKGNISGHLNVANEMEPPEIDDGIQLISPTDISLDANRTTAIVDELTSLIESVDLPTTVDSSTAVETKQKEEKNQLEDIKEQLMKEGRNVIVNKEKLSKLDKEIVSGITQEIMMGLISGVNKDDIKKGTPKEMVLMGALGYKFQGLGAKKRSELALQILNDKKSIFRAPMIKIFKMEDPKIKSIGHVKQQIAKMAKK